MEARDDKSSDVLVLIGIFKLLKAAALLALALAVHRLVHRSVAEVIERWARDVHVAPGRRIVQEFITKVGGLGQQKLAVFSVVISCYAGLFTTEGVGLILRKRWAEYVTVISTAGLLPLEVYELIKHATILKSLVLIFNILIVIYLVLQLARTRNRDGSNISD